MICSTIAEYAIALVGDLGVAGPAEYEADILLELFRGSLDHTYLLI